MQLQQSPFILYSDGEGNIFEDITLYATGRSGWDAYPVPVEDWIELPEGGQLYELPGRRGIGIDVKSGEMRLCEKGWAVAAFIPAFVIAAIILGIVQSLTHLPTAATPLLGVTVLLIVLAMSGLAAASAIRRVAHADPAELY